MAKLTGSFIKKCVDAGDIIITPFNPKNMGPNSYDLTLGPTFCTYKRGPDYHGGVVPLDSHRRQELITHEIGDKGFLLEPKVLYLGHTNETAGSTKYVPCIEGRSSMARLGIQVHLTAGFGDVGFIGQWTLEFSVVEPVIIYKNDKICQVYFDTLEGDIDRLYQGKYNNSIGVVASRSWQDSMANVPENGQRLCSVCSETQFHTHHGWTCRNGHGGAPAKEMTDGRD